jgi:hypothetical protein
MEERRVEEDDAKLPAPTWLHHAMVRILELGVENTLKEGVESVAIGLLQAIESDSLPTPEIRAIPSGGLVIQWRNGPAMGSFSVHGDTMREVYLGLNKSGRPIPLIRTNRDQVEGLRRMTAWLYPGTNGGKGPGLSGWR